jgi:hypothetical protein
MLLACAIFAAGFAGCAPRAMRLGGTTEPDAVIDELRRENVALRREVDQLSLQIERRLEQIEAMEQRQGRDPAVEDGVELPQFTSVRFGRYSGFLDTTGNGVDDTLRLYVQPRDQNGRFVNVAARAVVQAVALQPGREPTVIVERTFEPAEFTEAYRSSFTGTHYTLNVPIPTDVPSDIDSATVKIAVTDVATGVTATREATMRIQRE